MKETTHQSQLSQQLAGLRVNVLNSNTGTTATTNNTNHSPLNNTNTTASVPINNIHVNTKQPSSAPVQSATSPVLIRKNSSLRRLNEIKLDLASPAQSFLYSFNSLPESMYSFHSNNGTSVVPPTDSYAPGDEIGPYVLQKEIGTGAFSKVFEAKVESPVGSVQKSNSVAVKIIPKSSSTSAASSLSNSSKGGILHGHHHARSPDGSHIVHHEELLGSIDSVDNETCIWKKLFHPNIIALHDVVEAEDSIFVISEVAKGGNLYTYLTNHSQGIQEKQAARLFREIVYAVKYMHDLGIVHRDIKCENILLVDKQDDENTAFCARSPLHTLVDHSVHKISNKTSFNHQFQQQRNVNNNQSSSVGITSPVSTVSGSIASSNASSTTANNNGGGAKPLWIGNNAKNSNSNIALAQNQPKLEAMISSINRMPITPPASTDENPDYYKRPKSPLHTLHHFDSRGNQQAVTKPVGSPQDLGNYICKLADFGLSAYYVDGGSNSLENSSGSVASSPSSTVVNGGGPNCVGSIHYCSPEEIKGMQCGAVTSPASDIWSLGVVLYALTTGCLPFRDDFLPRLQLNIINCRYDREKMSNLSPELVSLLEGIFKPSKDRFTMDDIVHHPWVLQ